MKLVVIGGGAAGYFAAIRAAELLGSAAIDILEAGSKPLAKVEISGGGRCNVTHGCFEIDRFLESYPRGAIELRGAFSRFQASDTVDWFQSRGVKLKTEKDGRMFPVSDSSQTIIDCLEEAAKRSGVRVSTKSKVKEIVRKENKFVLSLMGKENREVEADVVILSPGGSKGGHRIAHSLGHKIVPPVASLFTFNISDLRLDDLAGVSSEDASLRLEVEGSKPLLSNGPLLITHWGLSGPAVLKLSAWGARLLSEADYCARLVVNWLPRPAEEVWGDLLSLRNNNPKKKPRTTVLEGIPKRLWQRFWEVSTVSEHTTWGEIGNKTLKQILREITEGSYQISGKGVFKEEFVTCEGVSLGEVDFRTMQSKLVPGLFFAGEILDIDGLTGGFNFQSAWTTGFLAGSGVALACGGEIYL